MAKKKKEQPPSPYSATLMRHGFRKGLMSPKTPAANKIINRSYSTSNRRYKYIHFAEDRKPILVVR